MSNEQNGTLDKQDLFLLMEAYRNNFETATTLLEQQKNLMDQFQQIISEQKATRESLVDVVKNLDVCAQAMDKYHLQLKTGTIEIKNEVLGELTKVKHKVNLVYVGIGAIIIPLTGFVIATVDKLTTLDAILHTLLKFNGVG